MPHTAHHDSHTIDFVGLMGVGKSTAIKLLSDHLQKPIVPENYDENPFLAKFYTHPKKFAFQSQLFFLVEKIKQIQKHCLENSGLSLVDTSVFQDVYSYAKAQKELKRLDDHHWNLYHKTFDVMKPHLPPTHALIYLKASMKNIRKRIEKRGRAFEQAIDIGYLELLHFLNEQLISQSKLPILTIETDHLNIVQSPTDQTSFVDQVSQFIQS